MHFLAHTQLDTENFARTLSLWIRPGFVILLNGELGSGKSTFARAMIKELAAGVGEFDIPSPTFSLVQTYDTTRIPVAHVDLYRLNSPQEALELGLDELIQTHAVLVEWPKEIVEHISDHMLILTFSGSGDAREIAISATGAWQQALSRNTQIVRFLKTSGHENVARRFLDGDASSRRYEKIEILPTPVILMDMPQRSDGPAIKNGKPYSAIAHLAEGLNAVVAINDQLCDFDYSAPRVLSCDMEQGLALIEDLGPNVYGSLMRAGQDMTEPMHMAVGVLADMAARDWPTALQNRDGKIYYMPPYDEQAQLVEVDLLPAWFHAHIHYSPAPDHLHASFEHLWKEVLPLTLPARSHWVLRDFHSPNLIWIPDRQGLKRVGVIDTQDALLGHPAYDLASLLQDARVDIDFVFADQLYAHYVSLRHAQGPFDEAEFSQAYAILGAQRATKILGIFARLNMRDGKPQYLHHMPRVSRYLARNLQHPALAKLKTWYETYLPDALMIGKRA